MIPRLKYSQKYINELEKFKDGVEKITNQDSKNKGQLLLKQLQDKVDLIDSLHSDTGFTNLKLTKEEIANTVKIRHQLAQLIK